MATKDRKTGYARLKYGEEEEIWEEADSEELQPKTKRSLSPRKRALVRTICVLLVAVLAVALWLGRDSTFFTNIGDWFHTRLVGMDTGSGYPTSITGTQVLPTNLLACDGMAVTLSDTSLTVQNATAKRVFSRQHSFSQPRMCEAGGRWLVYNLGGTGYRVETISKTVLTGTAEGDIQAVALAPNGRFALVTQTSDNASRLTVYMANGEVQYTYSFYDALITAVTLNNNGTRGVVSTVSTENGALSGTLYLLDFSKEQAEATFRAGDNLVLFLHWADNGSLMAVGDTAALYGSVSDFTFKNFEYGSASLCAYAAGENLVCLGLKGSAAPEAVFLGGEEPVRAELEEPPVSCSLFGGNAAVLTEERLMVLDTATGELLSVSEAERGARAVAMSSESTAYLLGVSDIRFCDFDSQAE